MQSNLMKGLVLAGAVSLSACATHTAHTGTTKADAPTAQAAGAAPVVPAAASVAPQERPEANLFIVFNEDLGRYYIFGDPELYRIYLDTDEVALTRAFIGDGPDGTSLIFGMNKEDTKRDGPMPAEKLYRGEVVPEGPFYGEVLKDGRYYVFFTWQDMADYLKQGEVPLTYTEIGVGPKGETVIYALNKETAKAGRPAAAIERFHKLHPQQAAPEQAAPAPAN